MAGDWIKMRTDLADDPAVIGIAEATGLSEDTVVGKLHRLWSWADRHTTDGNAAGVTGLWVNRFLGAEGFAEALESVNWFLCDGANVQFINFTRHNGQSAKARALTAKRVRNHKANAASVTIALTREEKRRGKKESKPKKDFVPPTIEQVQDLVEKRGYHFDPVAFVAHYQANGWVQNKGKPIVDWQAACTTWEQNWKRDNKPKPTGPRLPTAEEDAAWTP